MLAPSNPIEPARARPRVIIALLVGIAISALGLATNGSPVSAHTAFAGSTPANGSVVADPCRIARVWRDGIADAVGPIALERRAWPLWGPPP